MDVEGIYNLVQLLSLFTVWIISLQSLDKVQGHFIFAATFHAETLIIQFATMGFLDT